MSPCEFMLYVVLALAIVLPLIDPLLRHRCRLDEDFDE